MEQFSYSRKAANTQDVVAKIPLGANFSYFVEEVLIGTVRKVSSKEWVWSCQWSGAEGLAVTRKRATEDLWCSYVSKPKTVGIHADEMVQRARTVARTLGQRSTLAAAQMYCATGSSPGADAWLYEDDKVALFASDTNGMVHIVKKASEKSPCDNPVIMVDHFGVCYRTHGEVHYIQDHIKTLYDQTLSKL